MFAHNKKYLYIHAFLRGLIFLAPVWVAWELRYITLAELVLIEALIQSSQLVLELPTGALADVIGRKWTMTAGFFIYGVAMIVFFFAHTFLWFVLYAILVGLADAMVSGAQDALAYDTFKQEKKEHEFLEFSSKTTLIFQISLGIATLTGGLLSRIYLEIPVLAYTVLLFIVAFVTSMLIEPTLDTMKFTIRRYVSQTTRGVKELFADISITKLAVFYILVGGLSWACQLTFNFTLLTDTGHNTEAIGWIMGTIRFINAGLLYILTKKSKLFFNPRRFIPLFPIFMVISLLPGVFLREWIVIPAVAFAMLVSTARWAVLTKHINGFLTSRNRATSLSTLNMGVAIIYVVLTAAVAPVVYLFGDTRLMYTILGIFSFFVILPLGFHLARSHQN